MTPAEHIAFLEKIVKSQAENTVLWNIKQDDVLDLEYENRLIEQIEQLKLALRYLHAVIEKDVVIAKEINKEIQRG